ncbi:ADP-ribosylglycohydrolase family protein [Streptomyces sp. NPDC059524]|uniref:ADP-ribosylglycohydrolase family protein n=1 Tax=Streptomyces sp. NPDC059524 TaxID=3346856 RepID=UPI0036828AF1
MSQPAGPGPRFVPRAYINPRFEEDLQFNAVSSPPRYASRTERPVRYGAVADGQGTVTGYVWANDEDDAAGWIVRRDAGEKAAGDGTWALRLRDSKAAGRTPGEALRRLLDDGATPSGAHVIGSSIAWAPHVDGLYALADVPRDRVRDAAAGALYGLALGDAMGRPLSALPLDGIRSAYGEWTAMELPWHDGESGTPGDPRQAAVPRARVSDQTQLALAVAEALAETAVRPPQTEAEARHSLTTRGALPAPPWVTPPAVATALRTHLVRWLASPDNDRGAGRTTVDACTALRDPGNPWQAATALESKGCGAVVRAAAVGLAPYLSAEQRSGIAQAQAALTHGHPTALAASDLAAHAVHLLAHGCEPGALLDRLRAHAAASRRTYRAEWLGDLAERAGADSPAAYAERGWDECLVALDAVGAALAPADRDREPARAVGGAWTADIVLAGALYACLVTDAHPRHAIRRAAHTSGASAATAALAGAFAGAGRGADRWPREWTEAIEYGERVRVLSGAWDRS